MNDSLSFLHILSKRDALHVDADPIIGILKESICLSGMHKPHMQRHFTIHIVDKQNFQESLSNQDNSRSCNLSHFNVANPPQVNCMRGDLHFSLGFYSDAKLPLNYKSKE